MIEKPIGAIIFGANGEMQVRISDQPVETRQAYEVLARSSDELAALREAMKTPITK